MGVAGKNGAAGKGIRIADIEYSWTLNHEDIGLSNSALIDSAIAYDPFPQMEKNHGTAVLGVLMGRNNSYGVTGVAPDAQIYLAPAMTTTYGYNVARAINSAAARLVSGDVLLIEQQTYACGGAYGPMEADLAVFDAISLAVAKGIVVVEAAGNGGVNLDDPSCDNLFNPEVVTLAPLWLALVNQHGVLVTVFPTMARALMSKVGATQ